MQQIHQDRHAALAVGAAHARGFVTRTFTKPHRVLEMALLAAGVQGLVREYRIGFYHVDEALPHLALAIEVDGCYWHGCSVCGFPGHPGTQALDRRKTTYLCCKGWRVLRIPEHCITQDLASVVKELQEIIHGRTDQRSLA
jgi:very-short-patch-repair endonuclease